MNDNSRNFDKSMNLYTEFKNNTLDITLVLPLIFRFSYLHYSEQNAVQFTVYSTSLSAGLKGCIETIPCKSVIVKFQK